MSTLLSPAPLASDTADATLHAAEIRERGFTVLKDCLPVELIERWHAAFSEILDANLRASPPANRGTGRCYLDVPFAQPFSDPLVHDHPVIMPIVEAVLGADPVLLHLGADTPMLGSDYQEVHADVPTLFPGAEVTLPSFVLTVNFPLVDVTLENGPFEAAIGSHLLPLAQGQARIANCEMRLQPILLRRGDVMIRDPRMLHRGTPNRTAQPRPVVVVAYHRPWYRHSGFEPIAICPSLRPSLSERSRRLMRLHLDHARIV